MEEAASQFNQNLVETERSTLMSSGQQNVVYCKYWMVIRLTGRSHWKWVRMFRLCSSIDGAFGVKVPKGCRFESYHDHNSNPKETNKRRALLGPYFNTLGIRCYGKADR